MCYHLLRHCSIFLRISFEIHIGRLLYMMISMKKLWINFHMRLLCHSYSDRWPYQSFDRSADPLLLTLANSGSTDFLFFCQSR
jgi:hypothetical protein